MWEWVQTSRPMSSTPWPAWARARSSWRSRPLPPMPVSKRTIPSPLSIAQALPCGTPGQGSGKRSRQIPGSTFSVRGAFTRASPAIATSSQADERRLSRIWALRAARSRSGALELLEHAGDGEAESAGEGAPVGDADRDHVAARPDQGRHRGDHEEDRAELVDGDDPPAEVTWAPAGQPA